MKMVFLTGKDAKLTKSQGRENDVACFVIAEEMQ